PRVREGHAALPGQARLDAVRRRHPHPVLEQDGLRAPRQQEEVQDQVRVRPGAAEDVAPVRRPGGVLPRLGLGRHRQEALRRRRVGNAAESGSACKACCGLAPVGETGGNVIHRPAITPRRGMAVSKYSKKKEVTMKVLEFISLPDQSLKIVMDPKTIMDPWRISHLRSPIFRKAFPDADKYLDAIEASFPYLVPDPVIPAADESPRKLSFG